MASSWSGSDTGELSYFEYIGMRINVLLKKNNMPSINRARQGLPD